ncbi:glycerol kinase GlpK [Devosia sp. CN2-171]|uniref:glycerol kinase GlpK n=1 Tax=Devosia sp. CN2-171 TaxID=3400909 RepID=UPI003BF88C98
MSGYVLAIDQGTTSSRAILFDGRQQVLATAQKEFPQLYPASGWVEHDPEAIWASVVSTCRAAIRKARIRPAQIAAIGLTNQRETAVVWDRATGAPLHNAIVWQDRRGTALCQALRQRGLEETFTRKTGLLLDPYFSGSKLAWLLENVPGLRERATRGEVCFGTIDTFLIWRLTGGQVHATDATNASRTLLYNIDTNAWDDELLGLLGIPRAMLPEVFDCAADFGTTTVLGASIPILGVAGDQHAATIGQACFTPGMLKATYGTGCFALLNTGSKRVASSNRLLTTIAYRLDGKTSYALEGSIFVAGAAVQWLRDGLKIIRKAADSGALAVQADPAQAVYLVPAFVGLGAPWWDPEARGALFGLTRATGPAEIAKAALDSVAFQTGDLLAAMRSDWPDRGDTLLRADGGMTNSHWFVQRLADLLNAPVDLSHNLETTALGAAWLAGHRSGIWPDQAEFARDWSLARRFTPQMAPLERARSVTGWAEAVQRTLTRDA